jgi:hypothetical protein
MGPPRTLLCILRKRTNAIFVKLASVYTRIHISHHLRKGTHSLILYTSTIRICATIMTERFDISL